MYISKLVEGMNEEEFAEEKNPAEWKTYKVTSDEAASQSSYSKYKKYQYKSHSSLSQADTDAIDEFEDPF